MTAATFTKAQTLALYLFVVFAFAVLAVRTEINSGRIDDAHDRDRAAAVTNCELANDNARAINGLLDGIIAAVRESRMLTEAEKQQRIAFYETGRLDLAQCSPPPPNR